LNNTKKLTFSVILFIAVIGLFSVLHGGAYAQGPAVPFSAEAQTELTPFVVYYFHGTRRCYTCKKIEADSRNIITSAYAKEIKDKKLSLIDVNTDEKENKHFISDFGLVSSSVVLAERDKTGKIKRSKVLAKVWTLVRNESEFKGYILAQSKEFMEYSWL